MLDVAPNSTGNKFRAARIAILKDIVSRVLAEKSACRILDIGGTYGFWNVWRDAIDWNRTEIVCANLNPSHAADGKGFTPVKMMQANACKLDQVADGEFDVAFSNSVIEHVGRWSDMAAMATEVRRVAQRHLVQTPNFWFPIEPHARTPVLHWLPEPWAYRIVRSRKCGYWPKAQSVAEAVQRVQSAHMIDFAQMRELFPDSEIVRERVFGITKSLIALRR